MAFVTPFAPNQTLTIVGDVYQLEISPICAVYSELPYSSLELKVIDLPDSDSYETYEYYTDSSMIRNNVLVLDPDSIDLVTLNTLSTSNYSCLASSVWGQHKLSSKLNLIKTSLRKDGKTSSLQRVLHVLIFHVFTILTQESMDYRSSF